MRRAIARCEIPFREAISPIDAPRLISLSQDQPSARFLESVRSISGAVDLAFLAPDIVDAIIAGRQPVNLTANALIRAKHQRLWHDQRAMIAAL